MVNFSILISNSEVVGPGGLFDINFITSSCCSISIINDCLKRNILYSFINSYYRTKRVHIKNLAKASEMLEEANQLTAQLEQELNTV